jgi:hypothetical protein
VGDVDGVPMASSTGFALPGSQFFPLLPWLVVIGPGLQA